jgi:glycosyltransferase involved in cell wall biosynthesis
VDRRFAWPFVTRLDLGVADDDFVLMVIERLRARKNTKYLLQELAPLMNVRRDLKLLVLGYGPEKVPLMQLAQHLGVGPRVHFLGYQEYPYAFLRVADVFVSASQQEGLSNSLLEAMMMGVPSIVPQGHDDILEDLETGLRYTLRPGGRRLEEAVMLLLENKETCKALGENARRQFEQKHSIGTQTDHYLEAYGLVSGRLS